MKTAFLTLLCSAGVLLGACTATKSNIETPSQSVREVVAPKADKPKTMSAVEARLAEAEAKHGVYYRNHLKEFMAENPSAKKGQTVLLGDSLVERFPEELLFPDGSVINRGIGGDHVAGVRDRLDVSVADLKPAKVYMMIGINDVLWPQKPMEETKAEYAALLSELKEAAPQAEIVVAPVLPVGKSREKFLPIIKDFNAMVKAEASKHGVVYADIYDTFASPSGTLYPDLSNDGVHLSLEGYESLLQFGLPPEEFVDAAVLLYRQWKNSYEGQHAITKIDPPLGGEFPGNRGPDELVIYTPDYASDSTGTNEWGIEAIVVNNAVKEVVDGGDSVIPENGFVVSGHGEAMGWIQSTLQPGVGVRIENDKVILEPARGQELSQRDKLSAERIAKLSEIAKLEDEGASKSKIDSVKSELIDIYKKRRQAE